eukprot:4760832-Pleurochrysis_carterae.AAC.1
MAGCASRSRFWIRTISAVSVWARRAKWILIAGRILCTPRHSREARSCAAYAASSEYSQQIVCVLRPELGLAGPRSQHSRSVPSRRNRGSARS